MFRKKTETATFAAAGKTEVTNSYEAASRVSFWNLEIVYYLEPIMHAGIDLYQKLVLYAGYYVTSKDRHTKSILEMLRHQTSFDEVFLEKVPLHLGIYGNAFIELLKLRNDRKKIGDFTIIDPKLIDRSYDKQGNLEVDNRGQIKAFRLTSSNKRLEVGRDILWRKLKQVNNSDFGIGFIEPVYSDVTLKENIEQSKAQQSYRRGYPIPIIRYGDVNHPPNEKMFKVAKKIAEQLSNPDTNFAAIPSYFDVSVFGENLLSRQTDDMEQTLMYSTKLQAAVLHIPMGLLLQSASDENRASLKELMDMFEPSFYSFQRKLGIYDAIRMFVENRGGDPDSIEFEYGKLTDKSEKERTMRLQRLAKTGLIDVNDPEIKDYMKKLVLEVMK